MGGKIVLNPWSFEGLLLGGKMTFADIVETAAQMGVQGIDVNEIVMGLNPNPDPRRLREIRSVCGSFGIEITSCWFWADVLGGIVMGSFDQAIGHLERYLAIAAQLEARYITLHNGTPPKGMALNEGRSMLIRAYEKLGVLAERYGVIIGFEAPRPAAPFNSPAGALDLVKAFNSPYLTVTPDFESWRRPTEKMPMRYAEDPDMVQGEPLPIELFRECLPYSPYIHAKFLEFDETGTDPNYPLPEMFTAIREGGMEHDYCIEYEGWIPDIHPERDPYVETLKAIDLVRRATT